jgi:hypothetical protein
VESNNKYYDLQGDYNVSGKQLLEQMSSDAIYIADNDFKKYSEVFASLIIHEASRRIDELRSQGFEPTGYLIRKHFGLK